MHRRERTVRSAESDGGSGIRRGGVRQKERAWCDLIRPKKIERRNFAWIRIEWRDDPSAAIGFIRRRD